jgi:transcription factor SPN1
MEYDELPPTPPPKDIPVSKKAGTKRAPSFGAFAQGARREYLSQSPQDDDRHRKHLGGCASSDEEERARNKQVKKPRKQSLVATPPPESPAPITPISSPVTAKTGGLKQMVKPLHLINFKGSKSPNESKKENKERIVKNKKENAQARSKGFHLTKPLPTNSQHNSSELPESNDVPMSPAPIALKAIRTNACSPSSAVNAPRALKPAFTTQPLTESPIAKSSLLSPAADINTSPAGPKVKTLRRVRRLAPARRISFSSLVPPGEEADADGEGDGEEKGGRIELGSAFQLH